MMRWTATQILGGFIRWATATILAAVCLVWGFAPAEWFAGIWADPPIWLSHPITRIFILVIGIGLVVWLRPWTARASSTNNGEDISLDLVLQKILPESAWGQSQRAQGAVVDNPKQMEMWFWASELSRKAQSGELIITGRRSDSIDREQFSRDFWRVAALDTVPDDRRIWKAEVHPRDGVSKSIAKKIRDAAYVDLTARRCDVDNLWPAKAEFSENKPHRTLAIFGLALVATVVVLASYWFGWKNSSPPIASEAYWLPLSAQESEKLQKQLSPLVSSPVTVICGASECRDLAKSLADTFRKAGWSRTTLSGGGLEGIGVEGIDVWPLDDNARSLRTAIEVTTDLNINLPNIPRDKNHLDIVYITIGTKPFEP